MITAIPVVPAAGLLVLGGALGPPAQTILWALALLVDYSGIYLAGTSGWRVHSARHFAERHELIVIVALGESLVAIGVGVSGHPLSGPVVLAATFGVAIAVALWWLYFDVVAHVAERTLAASQGEERTRLARDSYTYLHFPIVVSIIYIALGMKKVLEYVADTHHHDLTERPHRNAPGRVVRRRRGVPARPCRVPPPQRRHLEPAPHDRRRGPAAPAAARLAAAGDRGAGHGRGAFS